MEIKRVATLATFFIILLLEHIFFWAKCAVLQYAIVNLAVSAKRIWGYRTTALVGHPESVVPVCLELETPRASERHDDAAPPLPILSPCGGAGNTDSKAEPPSLQTRGGSRAGRQRVVLPSRATSRFRLYQRGRA